MKVICSGMSKTGTKTLSSALRILGYKVFDFEEQFFYAGKELIKALNEGWTIEDLQAIFADVDAVTDAPACILWEDLLKAFPEAKVIHSERSSEEEYIKSVVKQYKSMKAEKVARFIAAVTPTGSRLKHMVDIIKRVSFSSSFDLNEPLGMLRYRQHNLYIRKVTPKEKLLIFNVTEGWEPLCKFLDKPVPKENFPHRNKGGSITREVIDKSYIFAPIRREFFVFLLFVFSSLSLFIYNVLF